MLPGRIYQKPVSSIFLLNSYIFGNYPDIDEIMTVLQALENEINGMAS